MWNSRIGIKYSYQNEEVAKLMRQIEQLANELQQQITIHERLKQSMNEQTKKDNQQQMTIQRLEALLQNELISKDQERGIPEKENTIQNKKRNEELEEQVKLANERNKDIKKQVQELENLVKDILYESQQAKKLHSEHEKTFMHKLEQMKEEEKKSTNQLKIENIQMSATIADYQLQNEDLKNQNMISNSKTIQLSKQMKELEELCQELLLKSSQGEEENITLKQQNEDLELKNKDLKAIQAAKLQSIQKSVLDLEKIERILNDDSSWKQIYSQNSHIQPKQNDLFQKFSAEDDEVNRLLEIRRMLIGELNLKTDTLKEKILSMRRRGEYNDQNEVEILKQQLEVAELQINAVNEQQELMNNQFECIISQLKAQLANKDDIISAKYQENKFLLAKISDLENNHKLFQQQQQHLSIPEIGGNQILNKQLENINEIPLKENNSSDRSNRNQHQDPIQEIPTKKNKIKDVMPNNLANLGFISYAQYSQNSRLPKEQKKITNNNTIYEESKQNTFEQIEVSENNSFNNLKKDNMDKIFAEQINLLNKYSQPTQKMTSYSPTQEEDPNKEYLSFKVQQDLDNYNDYLQESALDNREDEGKIKNKNLEEDLQQYHHNEQLMHQQIKSKQSINNSIYNLKINLKDIKPQSNSDDSNTKPISSKKQQNMNQEQLEQSLREELQKEEEGIPELETLIESGNEEDDNNYDQNLEIMNKRNDLNQGIIEENEQWLEEQEEFDEDNQYLNLDEEKEVQQSCNGEGEEFDDANEYEIEISQIQQRQMQIEKSLNELKIK